MTDDPPPYIELKARSAFSFGDSGVSAERLAERAGEMGYPAMALVDSTDLGGIIRFALQGRSSGVRPIAGAELRVDGHPIALLARPGTSPTPEAQAEAFREILKPLSHPFERGWNIGDLLGLTSL